MGLLEYSPSDSNPEKLVDHLKVSPEHEMPVNKKWRLNIRNATLFDKIKDVFYPIFHSKIALNKNETEIFEQLKPKIEKVIHFDITKGENSNKDQKKEWLETRLIYRQIYGSKIQKRLQQEGYALDVTPRDIREAEFNAMVEIEKNGADKSSIEKGYIKGVKEEILAKESREGFFQVAKDVWESDTETDNHKEQLELLAVKYYPEQFTEYLDGQIKNCKDEKKLEKLLDKRAELLTGYLWKISTNETKKALKKTHHILKQTNWELKGSSKYLLLDMFKNQLILKEYKKLMRSQPNKFDATLKNYLSNFFPGDTLYNKNIIETLNKIDAAITFTNKLPAGAPRVPLDSYSDYLKSSDEMPVRKDEGGKKAFTIRSDWENFRNANKDNMQNACTQLSLSIGEYVKWEKRPHKDNIDPNILECQLLAPLNYINTDKKNYLQNLAEKSITDDPKHQDLKIDVDAFISNKRDKKTESGHVFSEVAVADFSRATWLKDDKLFSAPGSGKTIADFENHFGAEVLSAVSPMFQQEAVEAIINKISEKTSDQILPFDNKDTVFNLKTENPDKLVLEISSSFNLRDSEKSEVLGICNATRKITISREALDWPTEFIEIMKEAGFDVEKEKMTFTKFDEWTQGKEIDSKIQEKWQTFKEKIQSKGWIETSLDISDLYFSYNEAKNGPSEI